MKKILMVIGKFYLEISGEIYNVKIIDELNNEYKFKHLLFKSRN